jgi:hypothetical protein
MEQLMKRYWIIIGMLLLLSVSIYAESQIVAISVRDAQTELTTRDLGKTVRALDSHGYGVLYYDAGSIIAVTPKTGNMLLCATVELAAYPSQEKLYLVSRLPDEKSMDLTSCGDVLYHLDAADILSSGLSELEIRSMIRNPFTLLNMEPMRFPGSDFHTLQPQEPRTDILQLVSNVNTAQVLSNIQALQDLGTRWAYADNHLLVAQWVQQRFQSYGMTDVQLQPFEWQGTTQYNVVATITGNVHPNEYIIVGAHHDDVSNTSDPYVLAPGADDNGSGTAACLEMARVIMQSGYQPKCSIRFVTFAAEEFGLWGSKWYATQAINANQNIRLMINHDMIANNTSAGDWLVRLMPYDHCFPHSDYASSITEEYTNLTPYYGSMNSGSSDSYPFWQRGYSVIYFFESDFCPYYHSVNDVVANINPAYCAEVIKASLACAAIFSDMPTPPNDLEVHDVGNGSSMLVSWDQNPDPQVNHYHVYHSTVNGQWGDPLSTSQTSLQINGLNEGQTYYFAVSSVDEFDNESYLVELSGVPLSVPLTPLSFNDHPQYQSINLTWEENGELDIAGYKIYRSQSAAVQGDQIGGGLVSGGSYLDQDVTGSQAYYYYRLCAVDNTGNASPFADIVKSRPVTLDQGICILDETENMSGTNPLQPNDVQVDDFYNAVMNHFNTTQLDLVSLGSDLRLADIGIYSTILWHGNDFASMDYPFFIRDQLQDYIDQGGNILFTVYNPSMAFALNASYPASFEPGDFIYDYIGIASVDYDSSSRFRYALPYYADFPEVEVDPLKTTAALIGHIIRIEGFTAAPDCEEIYQYGSDYLETEPQGIMNGQYVGVMNLNHSGKVITLSFPLYNMYADLSRSLIDYAFTEYFGETLVANDDPVAEVPALSVAECYPNPFRGSAHFRVESKDTDQALKVEVFNLRGQLVQTLWNAPTPRSVLLEWNGKDLHGANVSSGVYFLRASQNGTTIQKRIARIK